MRFAALAIVALLALSAAAPAAAQFKPGTLRVLFLHGSGEEGPVGGTFVSETDPWVKTYWGTISQFAREELQKFGVTTFKGLFLYTNTRGRGWTDEKLPLMYCNAIQSQKPDIIVTHSMGGLIIASGIQKKMTGCKLIGTGKSNVLWIQSAPPLDGSQAADFGELICKKTTDNTKGAMAALKGVFGSPCQTEGRELDPKIKLDGSKLSSNTMSLTTRVCKGAKIKETANKYASASMCGVQASVIGYGTKTFKRGQQAIHAALQVAANMPGCWKGTDNDLNDGLVGYTSCQLPGRKYDTTYTSPWYKAKIDHADASFRGGADADDDDKKPIRWLLGQLLRLYNLKKA